MVDPNISPGGEEIMASTDNSSIARSFFLAQDRLLGGPDDNLCADCYTAYLPGYPPMPLDGHKEFAKAFYIGFPDIRHTIEETIADGEAVSVRFQLNGRHTGDFAGIPATGRPVTINAIVTMRLNNGRVEELHGEFDRLGLMQQLGVVPSGN
jgi:predicted ester cyclase